MTALDKRFHRERLIDEKSCTLSIDPHGSKRTEKGTRNGLSLRWAERVNGDAGLAAALQASVNA